MGSNGSVSFDDLQNTFAWIILDGAIGRRIPAWLNDLAASSDLSPADLTTLTGMRDFFWQRTAEIFNGARVRVGFEFIDRVEKVGAFYYFR